MNTSGRRWSRFLGSILREENGMNLAPTLAITTVCCYRKRKQKCITRTTTPALSARVDVTSFSPAQPCQLGDAADLL